MGKNNDKKNFVWNTIGLTFNAFNSLFFLVIVKLVNGIEIAGVFSYSFALCCLMYFYALFFNRVYQVSDYNDKFTFNQYLTTRIVTALSSVLILFLFALINRFDTYKTSILLLLMLYKAFEAIGDCVYGQIQRDGNLYKVGISYTIKAIFGLGVFAIIDIFTKNLIISILGLAIVYFIFLITYDCSSVKSDYHEKIRFDFSKMKLLLIASFSIFVFSFLQNYLASNQKYVIDYFLNDEFQTVFGILIMPATLLNLIGTYLIMPFINDLTLSFKNKEISKFKSIVFKINAVLVMVGLIIIIVTNFIGIPILNTIYNMDLSIYKGMLLIILAGAIFNSLVMIMSSVLTILNVNKKQILLFMISSIISTILSIVLISNNGVIGAAYSYLLSYVLAMIIFYITYNRALKK